MILNAPHLRVGAFFFALGGRTPFREPAGARMAPDYTLDVVLYGLLVLGVFGFLWVYYDRRDRAYYDALRRKITFHCIRCDRLYTEKKGTETAPCPQCGHVNLRLKF